MVSGKTDYRGGSREQCAMLCVLSVAHMMLAP